MLPTPLFRCDSILNESATSSLADAGPFESQQHCDNPDHTALKAWRARRAGGRAEQALLDDLGRPVSMAAAPGLGVAR